VGPEITVTDVLALASGAALTATDTEHARELVGYLREGLNMRHPEGRRRAGVAIRTDLDRTRGASPADHGG
jgi:hypothetical protein